MEEVYRLIYTDELNANFILEKKYYPKNSEVLKLAQKEFELLKYIAEVMNFKLLVQDDFGELEKIKSIGR